MKKKRIRVIAIAIAAPIIFLVGAHWFNTSFNANVKKQPKMYVYERYRGAVNPAFFVRKESLIDSVVKYYRTFENYGATREPVFNFPTLTIPIDTCVYVMGYNSDSTAADVICYFKWSSGTTYERGYVYINTLHAEPPAKQEISQWKKALGID